MFASLMVATHPARRTLGALRTAQRCARAAAERPGVAFARAMQTGVFRPDMRFPYSPGRVAVMLWAADEDALEEAGAGPLAPLADGAAERWEVVLRPAGVHGSWEGFVPACDAAAGLRADEPAVVLIHGVLKPRYLLAFMRDNAKVGRQLAAAPGYLGGLGLADTPLTTASFSCWRSARDSRQFAFAAGAHREAYRIDQAEGRHATELFVRFRPVRSRGTLDGRDPFAGVLPGG